MKNGRKWFFELCAKTAKDKNTGIAALDLQGYFTYVHLFSALYTHPIRLATDGNSKNNPKVRNFSFLLSLKKLVMKLHRNCTIGLVRQICIKKVENVKKSGWPFRSYMKITKVRRFSDISWKLSVFQENDTNKNVLEIGFTHFMFYEFFWKTAGSGFLHFLQIRQKIETRGLPHWTRKVILHMSTYFQLYTRIQ